MLSTPPLVRAQLSEALSVISSHDFPRKWGTLLPELTERLKSGDAATVHVSMLQSPLAGQQHRLSNSKALVTYELLIPDMPLTTDGAALMSARL